MPVACIGAATLFFVTILAFVATIFGMLKTSEPCQGAVALASASTDVQAALGQPITIGFLVTGSINLDGTSGQAEFEIPISGPTGKATIHVRARKTAGEWAYPFLVVDLAGNDRRITLKAPSDAPIETETEARADR